MNNDEIKKLIGETFNDIADALETGHFKKIKIGLTTLGSEHGMDNLLEGALKASKQGVEVVLIGPKNNTNLETIPVSTEEEAHHVMEKLLDENIIQAAVTLHYNFDIGVSTIGKVITPACGKEMLIASTTGASDTDRTLAMVKNAVYGSITAKALGIKNPTVGVLNIDNARQTVKLLKKLNASGYLINFADSKRSDGGVIMRGNDLLMNSCDVMVCDTLTGNILMKLLSSFNTGGDYEVMGYGYGPGIGINQNRIINIISRASGSAVVANALIYAEDLVKGDLNAIVKEELELLKKANFDAIIEAYKSENSTKPKAAAFDMPKKETVTQEISGIDVLDLEEALTCVLKEQIYAETGMGCTGPIILVSEQNLEKAKTILQKAEYI